MITLLLAVAGGTAVPGYIPTGQRAGDPLPVGCTRVHAPVPSGKIVHAPAPIRCEGVRTVAQRHVARPAGVSGSAR